MHFILDESFPCPKCGERSLIYDGILAWRSGPRPPRELARKDAVMSTTGVFEAEYCYHCAQCHAEYFMDWESSSIELFDEGGSGLYIYNPPQGNWVCKFTDKQDGLKSKLRVHDKATGQWTVRPMDMKWVSELRQANRALRQAKLQQAKQRPG